ncbi:hypothetical protein [Acidipropionibacterium virtanenii]|uniref:hypothetical protein n=1 Tax=Acidipropionibacterium virtanenii TaxID=2057246 RepID=UPI0011BDEF82|nr:hypothetical protein [Acidipropionibacterium virtanenii]
MRDGTWSRVRRGAVVEGALSDDAVVRHCQLIAATTPILRADSWALSHTSAAVILGLPVPYEGLEAVWITRPKGRSAHRREQLMTRVCDIEDDEVITVDGLPVTCPERTAIDLARQHGLATGLMESTPSFVPAGASGGCRSSWAGVRGGGGARPLPERWNWRVPCRRVPENQ